MHSRKYLYFAKQSLRRLWRYVIRLFRFSNTFACVQRDAVLIFVLSLSQKAGSAQFCCKIQICNLGNGALLTFLTAVVCTKSARESGEMSYISAQSRKSSFRKIQIFDGTYSALPALPLFFFPRLGLRIITASCCFFEKCSRMGRDFSCLSLQSSSSFRKIQIFDSVYSALPLFLFLV